MWDNGDWAIISYFWEWNYKYFPQIILKFGMQKNCILNYIMHLIFLKNQAISGAGEGALRSSTLNFLHAQGLNLISGIVYLPIWWVQEALLKEV